MKPKIAYIVSRFPKLSETFILREMTELEQQGQQISLYPMIFQKETIMHKEVETWRPRMRYFPFLSSDILKTNRKQCLLRPDVYLKLWGKALWENRSSAKFLSRVIALFPKAVHIARVMQAEGIAHIHAHYGTHTAFVAWIIHQLTGINYSITVHAHDIFVRQEMLATKLRDAAFVIAISEYNREFLAKSVGAWIRDKTHVVHCGIRTPEYISNQPIWEKNERFEILCIGALEPKKGQAYLIQACTLLRNKGIPFRCRIIGGGKERAKLEAMIARNTLASEVELLGPHPQEEVTRLLKMAHCYVQPSVIMSSGKMEGIPVSIMEALACGLPVVASNLSGIPELVRPGETGYLVPPADAAALASTLASVYVEPERAIKMAHNGRALVQKEFDLQTNAKELSLLFTNTLNSA